MTIKLRHSRNLLAVVWIIGFIPPLLILAARTYFGTYYGGRETEAWGWFTPNIVPTIGLILATLAAAAAGKDAGDRAVSAFFFFVTLLLSVLYVVIFNLIFLLEPLADSPPLEIFKRSSLFLGIIQGLVTTALGVFFIRNAKSGDGEGDAKARNAVGPPSH